MMLLIDRGLQGIAQGSEACAGDHHDASNDFELKCARKGQRALPLIGLHAGDENLPGALSPEAAKML